MSREAFEEQVGLALDAIPEGLAALMDNCVVLVEESPPVHDPDLLGLYEGVPLTERGSTYTFATPDRVTIFRQPLLDMCASPEELTREIAITVVHEIAHHFGIDDARLHALGWG